MTDRRKCSICGLPTGLIFSAKIINKYEIDYFSCPNCGLLQTEDPFWLEEVYKNPINFFDTGVLSRNMKLSKRATVLLYLLFDRRAAYLDYAGGYGIFTRLMRDIGFNFFWHDPYSPNLMARGFEYKRDRDIELITVFETFEHLARPLVEIEKMLSISRNILFTTLLLPTEIPGPEDWWYYGREHGQHVSFYSLKTLNTIAKKYGLRLCSDHRNIHLLSEKPIENKIFDKLINSYDRLTYKDIFNLWTYLGGFAKENLMNVVDMKKRGLFEFLRDRMPSRTSGDMKYLKEDA